MSLNQSDVNKIAHLARLQINEQDVPEYAHNLSGILNLVDQMQSVDTTDIQPMAHPLDAVRHLHNDADAAEQLRTDEITEQNQRDKLQKNAPLVEKGLFLVPQVIE